MSDKVNGHNKSAILFLLLLLTTTAFGQVINFSKIEESQAQRAELKETKLHLTTRVAAHSKDKAILFGVLTAPFGAVQSVLLLTTDGGNSWQETLPAQYSSEVVGVSWASEQDVYAAVDFAVEGPGWEIQLFASRDGGKTWTERTALKKPFYWCQLDQMVFRGKTGLLSVSCDKEIAEPNAHERTFVTTDGGRTFRHSLFKVPPTKLFRKVSRGNDKVLWWLEDKGLEEYVLKNSALSKAIKINRWFVIEQGVLKETQSEE